MRNRATDISLRPLRKNNLTPIAKKNYSIHRCIIEFLCYVVDDLQEGYNRRCLADTKQLEIFECFYKDIDQPMYSKLRPSFIKITEYLEEIFQLKKDSFYIYFYLDREELLKPGFKALYKLEFPFYDNLDVLFGKDTYEVTVFSSIFKIMFGELLDKDSEVRCQDLLKNNNAATMALDQVSDKVTEFAKLFHRRFNGEIN